jgi:hypothetical protein
MMCRGGCSSVSTCFAKCLVRHMSWPLLTPLVTQEEENIIAALEASVKLLMLLISK